MIGRLPAPFGSHINRSQSLRFEFEGKSYCAYEGDTIASALIANGVWTFSRSFKYHRPRGPVSLSCCEANTLVTLNGVPNVFAERHVLQQNDVVLGQNYFGSVRYDRMAWLQYFSRFLRAGFYYRAFYRPSGAWKFWEPIIRTMAGLGRIRTDTTNDYYDKTYLFADVVVVGGGPAGLSGAIEAAGTGKRVILVDDGSKLGGSLNYSREDVDARLPGEKLNSLIARLAGLPNLMILSDASCEGVFSDQWLSVVQKRRLYKLRAKTVVLATGAIDLPSVFRRNDLPGILLGSAAQRLIHMYGVRPGECAVVLTANDEGYAVALDMADAGSRIAAIIDLRNKPGGGPFAKAVNERNLRVMHGYAIREAIGRHRVSAVNVAKIGLNGTAEKIACDLVCVNVGSAPNLALAAQAGASIRYDGASAQHIAGELPPKISIVGAATGVPAQNHPYPVFPHPKGKDFVDFDEDITVGDIEDSIAAGFENIQLLKRYSTLGMGPSQGRHSNVNAIRIAARFTQINEDVIGTTTYRPPYSGESFGVLAGRSFDPVRRTSMHYRHTQNGARMMVAGAWLRPAYYGAPTNAESLIAMEVSRVRTAVGIIDISTLGKIDVRGPQAAEFINRLYVTGHLKQPVGRVRYGLMTDATGTVTDDGVIARLDDQHFLVTATTTGAESVLRSMYVWNAQWQLDVDITNVTSAFSAVNIAGPNSRVLLKMLAPGVQLDPDEFPYMSIVSGLVAAIPARILRVGFVGELGFEVHVPSGCGEALWDAILDIGKHYEVVPFGVEAQRILRLEKGHFIVGQDTDGLTNPLEIGMPPSAAKAFFVGAAAIALFKERGLQRRLVGFRVPSDDAVPLKESHLVIEGGEIAGRVTSCAQSPTLNKTIGLAYVRPHQAESGTMFHIRGDRGSMIAAEVVPLPFYDPKNERQAV